MTKRHIFKHVPSNSRRKWSFTHDQSVFFFTPLLQPWSLIVSSSSISSFWSGRTNIVWLNPNQPEKREIRIIHTCSYCLISPAWSRQFQIFEMCSGGRTLMFSFVLLETAESPEKVKPIHPYSKTASIIRDGKGDEFTSIVCSWLVWSILD